MSFFWPFDTELKRLSVPFSGTSHQRMTQSWNHLCCTCCFVHAVSRGVCVFPNERTPMCVWSQWQMSERERQRGADGEMFLPWTVTEAALSLSVSRSIWAASLFFFFDVSCFVLFFSLGPFNKVLHCARPQPSALCRREARPLLCSQSTLPGCCSVIASKWILNRGN